MHRIGRTGRAGSNGIATSLVSHEEGPLLADIERTTRQRIEKVIVTGFEPSPVARSDTRQDKKPPHGKRQTSGSRGAHANRSNRSGEDSRPARKRKHGPSGGKPAKRRASADAAQGPAAPKPRRRGGRKAKRPTNGNTPERAHSPEGQPGTFHNALRAVASLFGSGQRN